MKFMMTKMMPMMSGSIEKMKFEDKEKMMDQMMPHMMANLSLDDKTRMMRKMMPMMMADMDREQMARMMDTMMPLMMNEMEKKGIAPFEMMKTMCPKCVSIATYNVSKEKKEEIRNEMTTLFERI
jgi:hypothetical protein